MKNNLETNVFKRFWNYLSKARYEKNLKYTEYKKTSPIWKYRILKVGFLLSCYGFGQYIVNRNISAKDDFHIIEQINEIINKNIDNINNMGLGMFLNEIKAHTANYYNINLVNNKESNIIIQIAKSLDPNIEKYIRVIKVDKLLTEQEYKEEAPEIVQKLK
jgi:hypothetical protein